MGRLEVWTALMTWLSRLAFAIQNGNPLLNERTVNRETDSNVILRLAAVNIPKKVRKLS